MRQPGSHPHQEDRENPAEVIIDLNEYPLIVAELDRLPTVPCIGPVIIDSKTGEPFNRRAFAGRWCEIPRAAGIPDDVWNRDSRAGGVTDGGMLGPTLRIFASMPDTRTPEQRSDTTAAHWQRPSLSLGFESSTGTSPEPRFQTRFKRFKRVKANLLK